MTARTFLLCALAFCAWLLAPLAQAHEVRPAYLDIEQRAADSYSISWKEPAMGEYALHLVPHLSNGWLERNPSDQFAATGFLIKTWNIHTRPGTDIDGQTVRFEGLDQTITDVLVRIRLLDGRKLDAVIHPEHPLLTLSLAHHDGLPVPAYLELGVEHILTGADHLMFVLGILLLVGIRWQLVKAITAFTVAHSITLALTALNVIHVPSSVIEALVALSIVFVASELAHDDPSTLTHRYPWIIAFTFGLLHGMAFAGALAEVGLPQDSIPLSLFFFNVGVEIGQLLFVSAAIASIFAWRFLRRRMPVSVSALAVRVPPYVIGGFAAFWFIGRLAVVFA